MASLTNIDDAKVKKQSTSKPKIAPKSKQVLDFAEELRQRNRRERSYSDSEIYDDILSFRDWNDDIYDDTISYSALAQNSATQDETEHPQTDSIAMSLEPKKTRGQKPPLLPKPDISKLFTKSLQPSSCEDIYDDVIVYRMRVSKLPLKPEVPHKPSHLYLDPRVRKMLQFQRKKRALDLEEIYDTSVSLAPVLTGKLDNKSADFDELYIDPTTIIQDSEMSNEIEPVTSSHAQDTNSNTESNHHSVRTNTLPVNRRESLYEVEDFVPQKMTVQTKESEYEVEDFVPNATNTTNTVHTQGNVYEIDDIEKQTKSESPHNQGGNLTFKGLDLSGDLSLPPRTKNPQKFATLPTKISLPAGRTKFDPLPELGTKQGEPTLEYSDSEEEYEEVTLYEDIQNYQQNSHDKDYEDLDKAIINALGLPEKIRGRATRIVRGKKTRQLQRSIKRRKKDKRPTSMQQFDEDLISKEIEKAKNINSGSHDSESVPYDSEAQSHDSEAESHDSEAKSHDPEPILPKTISQNEHSMLEQDTDNNPDVDQLNSIDDDELEDEPIPFGKSREVFEMLLDASGIRRVPSSVLTSAGRRCSVQEPIVEVRSDSEEESESNNNASHEFLDTSEFKRLKDVMSTDHQLKEYQDAGIVQLRSRSQIEEEIKNLTETAPPEPPPLPISRQARSRTKHIDRYDLISQKRLLLQRRHTVDS